MSDDRSGCLGFHLFETLLLVLIASGNFRDDKSPWGEHMAITSSEAVRIWVIVTLAMYLLSLHAEEALSLTPIFFLTSVSFHCCFLCLDALCLAFPYFQLIYFLLIFQGPMRMSLSLRNIPFLPTAQQNCSCPFWAPRAPVVPASGSSLHSYGPAGCLPLDKLLEA